MTPRPTLLASAQEMRRIDERTIREFKVPLSLLMENAGQGVATVIADRFGPLAGKEVAILAGRGNNGGDGLVAARYLANWGARVWVLLADRRRETRGAVRANLRLLVRQGIPVREVYNERTLERGLAELASADLIVDALCGTGLKGEVTGLWRRLLEGITASQRPVVAVDIPSGISAESGEILGAAVPARVTVTFGLLKRGHLLFPGRWYSGDVVLLDIGFPPQAIAQEPIAVELTERTWVARALPQRPPWAHKGDCGHLFLIAGSVGMTGAAALAAQAALRAGVGLVTVGCPRSAQPILALKLTEAMTLPLPETERGSLARGATEEILEGIPGKDVMALGPGLSRHPETQAMVQDLLPQLKLPTIIDADGLYSLPGEASFWQRLAAPWIMTPHPGEMGRLLGLPADAVDRQRIDLALERARAWKGVLLLKGAPTVVGSPEGHAYINPTGNAGMATAGAGDVLVGIIGALLAQGIPAEKAAVAGAYLHGLAGDLAAQRVGQLSLVAGDLIQELPRAILEVAEGGKA